MPIRRLSRAASTLTALTLASAAALVAAPASTAVGGPAAASLGSRSTLPARVTPSLAGVSSAPSRSGDHRRGARRGAGRVRATRARRPGV